jgi:hypothetical protein
MVEELHFLPQQPENDVRIYAFGGINGHNVTIVCQEEIPLIITAVAALRMDTAFRRLQSSSAIRIATGTTGRHRAPHRGRWN